MKIWSKEVPQQADICHVPALRNKISAYQVTKDELP